jgi:hypothetical protein
MTAQFMTLPKNPVLLGKVSLIKTDKGGSDGGGCHMGFFAWICLSNDMHHIEILALFMALFVIEPS